MNTRCRDPAGNEAGRKELNHNARAAARYFVRQPFIYRKKKGKISKRFLKRSKKLVDVYKAQKKAKKMKKRLAKVVAAYLRFFLRMLP